MQVILKQNIEKLGYKNDVVKVKDGYAVNYLIPQGYAIAATSSALKMHSENMKQQAHKAERELAEAKGLAEKLNTVVVKVAAKVGESGKIFGSINSVMLADALKKEGLNVERKSLTILDENIKTIGTYTATANLHKEVKAELKFEVVAE